jgi:hypothetical protein
MGFIDYGKSTLKAADCLGYSLLRILLKAIYMLLIDSSGGLGEGLPCRQDNYGGTLGLG